MSGQILGLLAALTAAAGIILWQRWREGPASRQDRLSSPPRGRGRGSARGRHGGPTRGGRRDRDAARQRRSLALGEATEARLAEESARLEEASRRYGAAIAASPPLLAPATCPAPWLHHLAGGFKWGLLLGILVEAAGLGLLALAGRQVRGAGL